jgi:hypothetical protein
MVVSQRIPMRDFKTGDPSVSSGGDTQYMAAVHPVAPEIARDGVVAFLSSTEREGAWELPRHLRAVAVFGNIELDLRGALIGWESP